MKKDDKNITMSITIFIFVDLFSTMIKTYLIYRISIFKIILFILPQMILFFWLLKNLLSLNKWMTVYLTLIITVLINIVSSLKLILELVIK
ncbi:hypothetical protein [Leptotrichia sp. oral taxon 221]|uniref:hypothetical protein n=1 Tax=Leptotrichia sp. oral taxon 221 TaxID=712362 RepID=UPI001B8C223D|nr:hypothetical protein [Leptotrichia sp. oral taxon 221]QUB98091.1 hypothetical protein J4863_09345 [Leptotrichia sp. oral taxon 221]